MTQHESTRSPRPWWVAIVSGMASYVDAAAITGFGTAIVVFQQALGLTDAEVGLSAGALTAGIGIGALIGGRLGDRYGRRPVFSVTMLMVIAGAATLAMATSFTTVLAGAILLGLGSGADLPVSLSTISEAAEDRNRGRLIGFTNLLWMAGVVVNLVLTGTVADLGMTGVAIIFGHIALVSVLILLGRLTIPESARWKDAQRERGSQPSATADSRVRVIDLLRAPYGVVFLTLVIFAVFTNAVANTLGQFGTYIIVNVGGATFAEAAFASLPLLPLGVAGYLWFMKIADRPVRFRYFQIGGVAFVLSPLVIAVFGVSMPTYIASLVLMSIGSAFAFEGIQRVWTQEQFPTLVRTTAQGGILAFQRFSGALLAAVTPAMLSGGGTALFALLSAGAAVGVACAWVVMRTRDAHDEFGRSRSLSAPPHTASGAPAV